MLFKFLLFKSKPLFQSPVVNVLDPQSAIEMLKNHAALKKDKDLCLEIAQVLTDSFHSNATASKSVDSKMLEASSCSCGRSK